MTSTLLTATPVDASPQEPGSTRRLFATTAGLLGGGLPFFLTLLNFDTDLTRTTNASRIFSGFFDFQARALLDGRVDIDPDLLGIEGFRSDGKTYMYFPPFPALLRLPVLMTTREFDHQLTLLSMAIAWIVFAVFVTKLAWLALSRVLDDGVPSKTSAALVSVFIAAATGGTVLTFDASLPWVYHEVYMWAVAGSTGGLYWLTRALIRPTTHELRWLCAFAFVAVGTRTTEGWALCLVALGCGAYLRLQRSDPARRRQWWKFLVAGGLPLAASIALNVYKFDAIYMFPLQDQVWTQVNEQRRLALAANGGTLTGLQFFTTSFMAYLRPDGIRFVEYFPWITLPAEPAPAFHGAFVDQTYRTGSVTAFMPLLLMLLLVAVLACFRPRTPGPLRVFRAPILAGVLTTGGVMAYGYYSTRYTSDFVPALVVGGAVGTALVAKWVQQRRLARAGAIVAFSLLTALALAAQVAIGYYTTAIFYRGDPLVEYVELQQRWSGAKIAEHVSWTDSFPEGGSTDDLAVRGDCETLFVHTGDKYEPWLPVQQRDRVITLARTDRLSAGRARLLEVEGKDPMWIDFELNDDREFRFTVRWGTNVGTSEWEAFPEDAPLDIGIRNHLDVQLWEFTVPGEFGASGPRSVAHLPSAYFDDDWNALEGTINLSGDPAAWEDLGLRRTSRLGADLELCRSLARTAGLDSTPGAGEW